MTTIEARRARFLDEIIERVRNDGHPDLVNYVKRYARKGFDRGVKEARAEGLTIVADDLSVGPSPA
jgi:hypothetical protein